MPKSWIVFFEPNNPEKSIQGQSLPPRDKAKKSAYLQQIRDTRINAARSFVKAHPEFTFRVRDRF